MYPTVNPVVVEHVNIFYGINNDRITLDVGPGVIELTLNIIGDYNEIVFSNTQPNVISLS